MTRTQMLAMLRKVINDEQATGFTEGGNLEQPEGTQELIHYLDRAIDEYSKRQAASKDIRLMKTMNVTTGSRVPNDFLALCRNAKEDSDEKINTGQPVLRFRRI